MKKFINTACVYMWYVLTKQIKNIKHSLHIMNAYCKYLCLNIK